MEWIIRLFHKEIFLTEIVQLCGKDKDLTGVALRV